MNRSGGAGDFEGWLDRELGRVLAAEQAPRPRAAQAAYQTRAGVRRRIGRLGAAALVATLAVAAGGAALATGSPNPVTWGQQVAQAFSTCADRAGGMCAGVLVGQRRETPADTAPERRAGAGQPAAAPEQPGQSVAGDSSSHGPAVKASPGGSGPQPDHSSRPHDHAQGQTKATPVPATPR